MKKLACLTAIICMQTYHTEGAGTNAVTSPEENLFKPVLEYHANIESFQERFNGQIGLRANPVAIDAFGYPASIIWAYRFGNGGYENHKRVADAGTDVFKNTFAYSLREAFVGAPTIRKLEDWGERTGNALFGGVKNALVGSIGNTSEEQIESVGSIASVTTTERVGERFRDKDMEKISYGFRPFRTSPYLYFTANIGRHNGRPAIISHTRFYSMLEDGGLARFEQRFTAPVSEHLYIGTGVSFYPTELRSPDKKLSYSANLQYLLGRRFDEGIFHFSLASSPREALMLAGGFSVAF